MDQPVNSPSWATEYAALLKKNIRLEKIIAMVHNGVLAVHSERGKKEGGFI